MSEIFAALSLGLILSFLALGIMIEFRIFAFADITTDGSLLFGAAVSGVLLNAGYHPLLATMSGFGAGCIGGVLTALLYTRCRINGLLAGILVIPTLFAARRHLTPENRLELNPENTFRHYAKQIAGDTGVMTDLVLVLIFLTLVILAALTLRWLFRTELGLAMRAAGENGPMARSVGISVRDMTALGLALANGLAGLTGALLTQYQGFADLPMGVGAIVWGLASVMIGETLLPGKRIGRAVFATIVGALIFGVLLTAARDWVGLNEGDLKFFAAMFVFLALMLPRVLQWRAWRREVARRAENSQSPSNV